MRYTLSTCVAVVALIGIGAPSEARMMRSTDSTTFVKKAAISDQFEIQSSQLALKKSQNSDIKRFAQQMIDDHTASTDKLKATLTKTNMAAPPSELNNQHQKALDKLNNASADEFDKDYIKDQKKGHKQAMKLLKSYSSNGNNADLKQWASEILPTVEHHADMLKDLNKNRNANKSALN